MTWIMQTTPKDFLHDILWNIPNMLDTAYTMLATPEMVVVILIGVFVWFLIYISK